MNLRTKKEYIYVYSANALYSLINSQIHEHKSPLGELFFLCVISFGSFSKKNFGLSKKNLYQMRGDCLHHHINSFQHTQTNIDKTYYHYLA